MLFAFAIFLISIFLFNLKVNLHAPECGRITTHESPAGALGIPEFMPPIRRRTFKVIVGTVVVEDMVISLGEEVTVFINLRLD